MNFCPVLLPGETEMMLRKLVLLCLWVAIFNGSPVSSCDDEPGQVVADFSLQDYRGHVHRLSEVPADHLVVVAFLGTECPLAKLYGPRLEKLQQQFSDQGVTFLGVNANSQDSLTEMAAYARIHQLTYPILKDQGNVVADQMQAKRTPEVFLLDRVRRVRYRGRIDDQYGLGYVRDEPQQEALRTALEQLLAGQQVNPASTEPVGCHIGRVKRPVATPTVTYSGQISKILKRRCVECHQAGEIAPFALTEYSEVSGWADMIAEVVEEGRMPPWHASPKHGKFLNDRRLSEEERTLLIQWAREGAPEGEKMAFESLVQPRESIWDLKTAPDLVLPIQKKSFKVPAEGAVRYQYFRMDPNLKEDRWVRAVQIRPGNRAVVHHILMFAVPPGTERGNFPGGASGYDGIFVPGIRVTPYEEGMAKRIKAGSELVFQVHYTPIGSKQEDLSSVGFWFAEESDVKYEVKTVSAHNASFRIPPGDAAYEVRAESDKLPVGSRLIEMNAHMHLRGKSFRYELHPPEGASTVLLDIPQYDFNWQTAYRLAAPYTLPSGGTIRCLAQFDNSEQNLNNPDPSKRVRWGSQTWDEMMIGYFDLAVPRGSLSDDPRRRRALELIRRFDKDGNGQIEKSEVPTMRGLFDRLDTNQDGVLTLPEFTKSIGLLRGR